MSQPPASPRRAVWSSSDFAKLDREDKRGRELLSALQKLKGLVDASPQEIAKLRVTYFNAGDGWDLEKLEADVARLEATKLTPSAPQEPPKETWVLPPGEDGEWDSSDDETPSPPTLVHVEGFVPSASFDGARSGMVFKRGDAGVGYYPDQLADIADLVVELQAAKLMPTASHPDAR